MRHESFDYIIVGAGSAGCVLANRLSEDPAARVLLLEAGGPDAHPLIHIPLGVGKLYEKNLFDWGYLSEPEPGLNGRRLKLTRGKVLGGSSSVNMMAFTRGHPADFDRWASKGASGWSYREVLPYFIKSERWQHGGSATRGGDGPVGVEFARFEDPITDAWTEAGRQRGYTVTDDYNGSQQEGFGRGQYSIHNGRRVSTAVAYLRPALRRRNLTLHTGVLAKQILFEGSRAIGVQYTRNGVIGTCHAEREVIVAGGAFNSPQLLMLSGIGPAAELRAHGIRPLVDLPVGRNLQEHLGVRLYWERRDRSPFHRAMRFDRMALSMLRAHLFGTGVATTHPSAMHAFIKSAPNLAAPDIEFIFRYAPQDAHLWFPGVRAPYADGYGLVPVLLHPRSRGQVRLRSASHTDPVRINYCAFAEPSDLQTLRRGVELARELGESAALEGLRGRETAPGSLLSTAQQIDDWIRNTAVPVHHPVGTCAMAGPEAVLDPGLSVYGVQGLRVVDASVMPDLVSAHINASVIMIAERAADLILGRPQRAATTPESAVQVGVPT